MEKGGMEGGSLEKGGQRVEGAGTAVGVGMLSLHWLCLTRGERNPRPSTSWLPRFADGQL